MDIPQLATAVMALSAVVLGPLISIYVARRQFAAPVLSADRQQLINTLRDRVADLAGFISHIGPRRAPVGCMTRQM